MYPLKLFQFLLHFLLLQLIYFDEREIPFKKILLPIYSSPFKNTRLTLTRNIHNEIHPRPTVSKLRQTPSKSQQSNITPLINQSRTKERSKNALSRFEPPSFEKEIFLSHPLLDPLLQKYGYRGRGGGRARRWRRAKKRDMCETKVTGRMVGVRKDRRTDGRCRWWQTRGGTEEDEVGGNPTPGRTEGNVRAPLPASVPFPTTSSSLLSAGCSSSRGHDPSSRRLIRGTVNPLEESRRAYYYARPLHRLSSSSSSSSFGRNGPLGGAGELNYVPRGEDWRRGFLLFFFLFFSFLSRERKVIKKLRILKDGRWCNYYYYYYFLDGFFK